MVVCLCAQWCGVCRDYRDVFAAAAVRHPRLMFRWIDIEDEAELAGDMDVQTFPTLVVADRQGQLVFSGPLPPQPGLLDRLLRQTSAADGAALPIAVDPAAEALLLNLQRA